MKLDYPAISKETLCKLFGKTRHALYDRQWHTREVDMRDEIILQLVHGIRERLPRIGARKLLFMLQPSLQSHRIKIGRDALFELLASHRLLVRRRKRKVVTTDSKHWMRKYSNLIRQATIDRPEQVWVSDITYVRLADNWGYLSMVTDAYSRRIMGFAFRRDMLTEGCVTALEMAVSNRCHPGVPLIHHSDRGSQYCSRDYIDLLTSNGIGISMTENGDPYENALAERMNGIIKNEFNLQSTLDNFDETYDSIIKIVDTYNNLRPHSSCNYMTPSKAHLQQQVLPKRWKTYPKSWQKKHPSNAGENPDPTKSQKTTILTPYTAPGNL